MRNVLRKGARGFNVLISSSGRRVGLMECFRDALKRAQVRGRVCAIDCSPTAPAFHLADKAWLVPRCTDPHFATNALEIARSEGIHLIVPTIDPELPVFAEVKSLFAKNGVIVAVSNEQTISICVDKVLTHHWLADHSFPTVRQASPEQVLQDLSEWPFPLIAKPRNGSASVGVRRLWSASELEPLARAGGQIIVQEVARGEEYTVNVYVDRQGRCRCAVPHRRLEIRAGEVSKGVTVKDRRLMKLARDIAERLPGAYGPLNIQCFLAKDGDVRVIEINPRFGGGYPLAHKAGAHFTEWLVQEVLDLPLSVSFDGWQDNLAMLRYDEAVYLPGVRLREKSHDNVVRGL